MRPPLTLAYFMATLLLACIAGKAAFSRCPVEGDAVTAGVRSLNRLKNRATPPVAQDIDSTVTLTALLAPGDDRDRWSERQAAIVVGYVRDVKVGGVETVNCHAKTPEHRDTHIELVTHPEEGEQLPLIVEVTPRWRESAASQGGDWSTDSLRSSLLGRWVRITGWLLFDTEHEREAENTAPGRAGNWRATAWELHPVTRVEVVAPPTTGRRSDPSAPQRHVLDDLRQPQVAE